MKKILSVFLAILMMFSMFTVCSYADDPPASGSSETGSETGSGTSGETGSGTGTGTGTGSGTETGTGEGTDEWHAANALGPEQVVLVFKIEGGKYSEGQYVWDNVETHRHMYKSPEEMVNYEPYVMIPMDADSQKPGSTVALPNVDGKTGYTFVGWYCYKDGQTYAPGYTGYTIPETINGQSTAGTVINFLAVYRPTKVEEDTFAKVFDILAKIFGTVIGLIAYEGDTEAGIAFVKKVFSGISG